MEKRIPHYDLSAIKSAVRLPGDVTFGWGYRDSVQGEIMKRECLSCGQKEMAYAVRDVPYSYKDHETVISKVKGWHCSHCGEVEFDPGEGVRFAETMK